MKHTGFIPKVILLFIFLSVVTVQVTAQKVTLVYKDVTFEKVLNSIKQQTGLSLVFSEQIVDVNRKVSINATSIEVKDALKILLKDTNVDYEIKKNKLYLVEKKTNEKIDSKSTEKKITGLVTDSEGEPIIGATIVLRGSNTGTITNVDGLFSLEATEKSEITLSYIGYVQTALIVGKANNYKIILEEDTKTLDEVVVIGYGTQKKGNITGAISSLTDKEFSERSNTTFGSSMQGKSAGVQVTIPTGKPQSGFSIRVRGTSSINAGSEPLYVVDGIPTSGTKDINPSDIESMSILKDAASAAIYGSSGSNGVVIITTKRGTIQKPVVDFNVSVGTTAAHKRLDVLNATQYKALMTEMGRTLDWTAYPHNTNWQDEVFRTGLLQNYQASVKGGTEKSRYYLSGGLTNTEGIIQTNKVERYNFKMNLDLTPTDWLRLGGNFGFSSWKDVDVPESRSAGKGGTIMSMLNTTPIISIYNPDGSFTGSPFMASFENPLAAIYGTENLYRSSSVLGNVYLEIEPMKNLVLKTTLGIDVKNGKYEEFLDPYKTDWGRANVGYAYEFADMYNYLISQNTISYKNSISGAHNFSLLGGYIVSTKSNESLSASSKNFSSTAVKTVNGGSVMSGMGSDKYIINNMSYILNANYDYKEKYLLTANFRADGASNFGKSNPWGYFPSFSAGWRLSKEDFLSDIAAISDIKIRAGWGQVGNSGISAYASYGTMSGAPYVINGTIQSGKIPSTIDNRDLRWEATEQSNIGLDLAFFNFRLAFTIDAYYKKTKDLLYDYPLPLSTGYGSSVINIGQVSNKGLEFSVSSKNLVRAFKWSTDFNISFNKNMVLDLGNKDLMVGYIYQREEVSIIREGYPLGTFYGYVSEGVNEANGMIKYKGANANGDVSDNNKEVIGDANPLFNAGLINTFAYKGFDLSILLQAVYGNDIFNATRIDTEGVYNFYNQSNRTIKRWKVPGQKTDMPKAMYGSTANSLISSRFIEDGSFLRVKSISLGYTVPQNFLVKKDLFKELKCYVTMENILTLTKYTGYDPEVSMYHNGSSSEQNGAVGIDYGTYPQPRNIILGLILKL